MGEGVHGVSLNFPLPIYLVPAPSFISSSCLSMLFLFAKICKYMEKICNFFATLHIFSWLPAPLWGGTGGSEAPTSHIFNSCFPYLLLPPPAPFHSGSLLFVPFLLGNITKCSQFRPVSATSGLLLPALSSPGLPPSCPHPHH